MAKQQNLKQSYEISAFETLIDVSSEKESEIADTRWIELEQIIPASNQPRRYFSPEKLEELAASFKAQGFKGAINVRPRNGSYEIVAGERRYRAAKLASLEQVRCLVDDYSDEDAYEFAMRENLNRENLSKLEEVEGILHLIRLRHGLTRQRVISLIQSEGNRIRRAEGNVSLSPEMKQVTKILGQFGIQLETFRTKYVLLLKLPDDLKTAHLDGSLGYNHVLELDKVKDTDRRALLLKAAIQKKQSVRKIKEQVKATLKGTTPKKIKLAGQGPPPPVEKLWRQLTKAPIWNDPQIVEMLLSAMQSALSDEPQNHSPINRLDKEAP